MLSLDLVNLEQDVCSQLFASAQCPIHGWKEREVQHWQGKWGLLSPNWCAKNILYWQKIMCSCSFGPSWHIYTVRQLSITAHAQVTTAWNSSVDVALQVGSAVVSDEPFGHCFSKAGFQHPVCGLLQHSGKKKKKKNLHCFLSCSQLRMPKWDIKCCILCLLTSAIDMTVYVSKNPQT